MDIRHAIVAALMHAALAVGVPVSPFVNANNCGVAWTQPSGDCWFIDIYPADRTGGCGYWINPTAPTGQRVAEAHTWEWKNGRLVYEHQPAKW